MVKKVTEVLAIDRVNGLPKEKSTKDSSQIT